MDKDLDNILSTNTVTRFLEPVSSQALNELSSFPLLEQNITS